MSQKLLYNLTKNKRKKKKNDRSIDWSSCSLNDRLEVIDCVQLKRI